ncbi:hypothetical protein GIB67_042535 [Kingdonia uniflora]|uniref:RING-type domain-containing protein n=1 Tax=Kingdonia uniflora TaxID=39325 RepID=A0A7J7M117_9MAGN|nr:hypothetical protein GIB67_042535 [Kingdonia uniflora]
MKCDIGAPDHAYSKLTMENDHGSRRTGVNVQTRRCALSNYNFGSMASLLSDRRMIHEINDGDLQINISVQRPSIIRMSLPDFLDFFTAPQRWKIINDLERQTAAMDIDIGDNFLQVHENRFFSYALHTVRDAQDMEIDEVVIVVAIKILTTIKPNHNVNFILSPITTLEEPQRFSGYNNETNHISSQDILEDPPSDNDSEPMEEFDNEENADEPVQFFYYYYPASKAVVEQLVTKVIGEGNEAGNVKCSICLKILRNAEVTEMSCKHEYHSICLRDWLSTRNTCPICRHALPVD